MENHGPGDWVYQDKNNSLWKELLGIECKFSGMDEVHVVYHNQLRIRNNHPN